MMSQRKKRVLLNQKQDKVHEESVFSAMNWRKLHQTISKNVHIAIGSRSHLIDEMIESL